MRREGVRWVGGCCCLEEVREGERFGGDDVGGLRGGGESGGVVVEGGEEGLRRKEGEHRDGEG